jgi:hypothetical protein
MAGIGPPLLALLLLLMVRAYANGSCRAWHILAWLVALCLLSLSGGCRTSIDGCPPPAPMEGDPYGAGMDWWSP